MLKLEAVDTFYGPSQALFGMALTIGEGEVVTLMGRNGMGKTTTVNTIMGIVPAAGGRVLLDGQEIQTLPSHRIARLGIGLVPEGRQVFPNLSLRENLVATAANRLAHDHPWTLERVLELFPGLGERLGAMASVLSGGEQQMLAIGRALMTNPRLLLLDEATEGLAPMVREKIWRSLGILKAQGLAILVIDKNVKQLARIADRHVIIEKGRPVWSGDTAQLLADPRILSRYLGLEAEAS
jgi:branched-chain amino acid transport system ATP-binding protein